MTSSLNNGFSKICQNCTEKSLLQTTMQNTATAAFLFNFVACVCSELYCISRTANKRKSNLLHAFIYSVHHRTIASIQA